MNWVKNEVSGAYETTFNGKLLSVSDKTLENSNGKQYKVASVGVGDKVFTGIIHQKSFDHGMTTGVSYQCKGIYDESRGKDVLIVVSHLVVGQRATIDDFEFEATEVKENIFQGAASEFDV